jgi:hypothetical protein
VLAAVVYLSHYNDDFAFDAKLKAEREALINKVLQDLRGDYEPLA